MIDVKETARVAKQYFDEIYADNNFEDVLLEEVIFDEEIKAWFITLGCTLPSAETHILGIPTNYPGKRKYKIFEVDAESGKVLSMRIHSIEQSNA